MALKILVNYFILLSNIFFISYQFLLINCFVFEDEDNEDVQKEEEILLDFFVRDSNAPHDGQ